MAVLLKLCTVFMFWILQHLIYKDFYSVALKGEAGWLLHATSRFGCKPFLLLTSHA